MWSEELTGSNGDTAKTSALPLLAAAARIGDELRQASDATIDECITAADPLVLRGLLYQLTGDEELAGMTVERQVRGYTSVEALTSEADVRRIHAKAAHLLRQLRDSGETEIHIGPIERLPRSLEFAAGTELPASEMALWIEETGLDPFARGINWRRQPTREQKESFFVVVIGGGISGVNAAVHLKVAGIPFVVVEKNSGAGGVWFDNRYPGIRIDTPSRGYLHLFGLNCPQPYSYCPGEENVRYMDWVLDEYGLRPHFVFDTEVSALAWDE